MESLKNLLGVTNQDKQVQINYLSIDNQCKRYNQTKVDDKYYQCDKCFNKGFIAVNQNDLMTLKICECRKIRESRRKLDSIGLLDFLDENNSFDSFKVAEEWQRKIVETAKEFVKDYNGNFFFIGGAIGSGKTKICTTILANILKDFDSFEYFSWDGRYKEIDKDLKEALMNCDVLYIDDFLRGRDKTPVTDQERVLAKSIIDYRYLNKLTTIISSELYLTEIGDIDQAIYGRIYQRCKSKKYICNVKKDRIRDYRLKEVENNL